MCSSNCKYCLNEQSGPAQPKLSRVVSCPHLKWVETRRDYMHANILEHYFRCAATACGGVWDMTHTDGDLDAFPSQALEAMQEFDTKFESRKEEDACYNS